MKKNLYVVLIIESNGKALESPDIIYKDYPKYAMFDHITSAETYCSFLNRDTPGAKYMVAKVKSLVLEPLPAPEIKII